MVAKLREAAEIYRKTPETIDWLVHQDVHDPKKFAIVERFVNEASQKYHLEEPYWAVSRYRPPVTLAACLSSHKSCQTPPHRQTFNPAVEPWLAKPIEILRFNEL